MTRHRLIAFAAACLAMLGPCLAGSPFGRDDEAQDGYVQAVRPEFPERAGARRVKLGLSKSIVVELPLDAKDILVSNPKIAEAVLRTSRRAFLIGVEPGQTNVMFFDVQGQQILALDLQVERDLAALAATLRRVLPAADIRLEGVGDGVALTGVVQNAADAAKAAELAGRYVGDQKKVVNALTIKGGEQVLLKVTIAEVQRNIVKQLGIDVGGQITTGNAIFSAITQNPFLIAGKPLADTFMKGLGATSCSIGTTASNLNIPIATPGCSFLDATIRALEQNSLLKTLAEPTLTAVSGESASFLAGGEFPVPVGQDDKGRILIEFKQFGVGLSFTPVVLSEGRISLRVKSEVSELSQDGAFVISNINSSGLTIPALKTRRAETTVELPSGGSLAIAGLIRDDVKQGLSGLPGLMKVPVLGALFKSRDYQRGQTELVIVATPYIARSVARPKLAQPDDGLETPSDASGSLLGRLNRVYGTTGAPPPAGYRGQYGFIID